MSLAKGVLGAFGGGFVGSALWIGVAFASGWDIGLLAILIGGAAGFGMGLGNQGRGGMAAGILAAAITVVCILGAKVGVAYYVTQHHLAEMDTNVTEEEARETLLDQVYTQFESEEREMTYVDDDEYPPEVWQEADRRWHAMSLHEREEFRVGLEMEMREGIDEAAGMFTVWALIWSFRPFALVCLFLAASTAFKTASMKMEKGADEVDIDATAQAPAMFRMAPPPPAPAPVLAQPQHAAPSKPMQPEPEQPTGLGIFARLGQESSTPAPAHSAPPKVEEAPTGQGIFARLGQEQSSPAPTPAPIAAKPPGPAAPLAPEVGLINLDLGDERQAA